MRITFFGAAQGVTGSKHLIEVGGFKLLLDCGLHQGKRSVVEEWNRNLPFKAGDIDAVILSHGHLDHCGALPILVRDGFKGSIHCSDATADIARCMLEDSGMLQKQITNDLNSKRTEGEFITPLYTQEDAKRVFPHLKPHPYVRESHAWITLNGNIRFKLYDAGHILGSSVILLEIQDEGTKKTLAFTGDLGREDVPIIHSREYIEEEVDTLVMECTYGNKNHRPISDVAGDLKEIITTIVRTRGKVIVPAFSLGRTQELIYALHKLADAHEIPRIPIYIDSPLAQSFTEIFGRHQRDFSDMVMHEFKARGESPFAFKDLIYTHGVEESKILNRKEGPLMVISASGMSEGGRVLHHLKHGVSNPNNIILITGYQAEDTLGRKIKDGISPVKILGESYEVRAQIKVLDELSAHADQSGLLLYLAKTKGVKNVFLVHTEMPQAITFKQKVGEIYPPLKVAIPERGEVFDI
ncbi:MAG: MBL fold metallo-hydrolase [Parcubacteria group bacterium]|nr:MBL fold metallo-hydrolase [Parcubacteria group bacterium]